MPSENEVLNVLRGVLDPELGKSIVELNMVRDVKISADGIVEFSLALTVPSCPMKDQMSRAAEGALRGLPWVRGVKINMTAMTDEERRAVMGSAAPQLPKLNQFNRIRQVIAVMSGKGGVGKSSVTALLAVALARRCQKVGILDADITGPSIPRLFELPSGGLRGSNQGMLPAVTSLGIKAVSVNLLVPEEDTPVIWRGPMASGAINQFWSDTLWGKLDTLLVDLPPGTGDAALTVLKNLPVDGVVMVTTPQSLASLVVRKAVHMLKELETPVLGVVENMSYFNCPDCGARHEIFGPSHAGEIAAAAGSPLAACLPIDPRITALGDAGKIEEAVVPEIDGMVDLLLKLEKIKTEN